MSTLKQAFKFFCLRETRRSLSSLMAIKIKILSEEATTALAGFHAGPCSSIWVCWILWREENRRTRRKTLRAWWEPATNSFHRIRPRSHWWEASIPTSASSLLPGQDVPQYNLNTQIILGLRFQFGRPQGWSQLHKPQGLCSLLSRVLSLSMHNTYIA